MNDDTPSSVTPRNGDGSIKHGPMSLVGPPERAQATDSPPPAANGLFDQIKHGVSDLRDRAGIAEASVGVQVSALADKGIAGAQDVADSVKSLYHQYSDSTQTYIAANPVRSLVISAALGAAVTALVMNALQNRN